MGDSVAEVPASPGGQPDGGLRASDADRDEVVTRLQAEYAAGRLSHDTFLHRMDAVLGTKHRRDLPAFVADLPGTATRPSVWARVPAALRALTSWLRGALWPAAVPVRGPGRYSGENGFGDPAVRPSRRLTTGMRLSGGIPGYFPLPLDGPQPLPFPRSDASSFSIGRDASCDLSIGDMSVSRLHARLERSADGWLLTDLGSTNGTRVNGWRVSDRAPVRPGDIVTFGNTEYTLMASEALAVFTVCPEQSPRRVPAPMP